jgi:hypothetical protein
MADRLLDVWKLQKEARELDFQTVRAYCVAYAGRWENRNYLNESVAIRRGAQVYVITASFPAEDDETRTQIHEAIANAIELH